MHHFVQIKWFVLHHQVAAECITHTQFCVLSLNNLKLTIAQEPDHNLAVWTPCDNESLSAPQPFRRNLFFSLDTTLHLVRTVCMAAEVSLVLITHKARQHIERMRPGLHFLVL